MSKTATTTGRDFSIAACKHLEIDIKKVRVESVELISNSDDLLRLAVYIHISAADMEVIASNMKEQALCER